MQKYLIIFMIILMAVIGALWMQLGSAHEKWERAEANVKAYANQLDDSGKKNTALQLNVDQLSYFNDSVLKALDATRKELKIKDKNLKALQAVSSKFSKRDTIWIPGDTIFKESTLNIDTVMGDKWYQLHLGLKYPSTIIVDPCFKSDKHIIVSTKKETVNPPKKFFLFRWFQKKMTVVHIDVIEKNPYVDDEESKYVEIIK
jgi:hypothetical protein